jgi:orotidine-5'-phosphate decarboxylase
MRNPIIVALDVSTAAEALGLARELSGVVGGFKIGKELFVSEGPDIVRAIRDEGGAVFLDLKFHDIPNTVAKAVAAAARLDVQMLTIHTSGGRDMMAAAEVAAREAENTPLILGVTVLTSIDGSDLGEMGLPVDPAGQVERLAKLATGSGLRGLVCSPLEIKMLRKSIPREVQLVTPGIRPAGSNTGDQKRTLTPTEAMEAGADWLVIGRPITAAGNLREAAEEILESLPGK